MESGAADEFMAALSKDPAFKDMIEGVNMSESGYKSIFVIMIAEFDEDFIKMNKSKKREEGEYQTEEYDSGIKQKVQTGYAKLTPRKDVQDAFEKLKDVSKTIRDVDQQLKASLSTKQSAEKRDESDSHHR